ncbi:PQQ-binding-like beta-propeller repeat protein [Maioricimonas sp. JC845]|uniref:outer membrane protein assembly factor BamB family protein n=1 Tax=Maioricimonas sp. JC845 TaxID=3232138 RepID=UPI00345A96FC
MRFLFLMTLCIAGMSATARADWRQFRGNDTNGIADSTAPTSWTDEDNIAWKADLTGRGLSSPIVVGDRVVVTCSSGYRQERLHVVCFSTEDGSKLWERQFWATGRTGTHTKTCVAAPTPVSDGERIFATYSSNDVVCLDLDGNLLWYRGLGYDFPNASNSLGMSSSPVMAGDTLVVMVENDAESFTTGIDPATGQSRWKIDRPRRANWTSPALWPGETPADDRVLVQSSAGVVAVVPETGEVEWTYADGASTIPSLTVSGNIAFVPSHGITALRPGQSNPEVPEIVWQEGSLSPGTASPLVHDESVYVFNRAGVLTAADVEDGSRQWQLRLKGPFSGSPVLAGGHLYAFNEDGLGQVVRLGDGKGEIVSSHSFDETILCTPAVSDGAIYIRSDGHLWKIANE